MFHINFIVLKYLLCLRLLVLYSALSILSEIVLYKINILLK